MGTNLKIAVLRIIPIVVLLAVWELIVVLSPNYEFFLGSPQGILAEASSLYNQGSLVRDFFVTALEALLGFIAGSVLGTAVGLGLWFSETTYRVTKPYLIALGSLPVFALGPILIFWVGTGILSKIVLGFLSTFVIAIVQAHTGATEADSNLLKMVKSYGATRRQSFRLVIAPSAVIWVMAGIRLNIGMALLGAFIGEFISSRMGLGHLIIVAEGLFNVNQIWVGVLGILSIALLFHFSTAPIEKWAKRWKN